MLSPPAPVAPRLHLGSVAQIHAVGFRTDTSLSIGETGLPFKTTRPSLVIPRLQSVPSVVMDRLAHRRGGEGAHVVLYALVGVVHEHLAAHLSTPHHRGHDCCWPEMCDCKILSIPTPPTKKKTNPPQSGTKDCGGNGVFNCCCCHHTRVRSARA